MVQEKEGEPGDFFRVRAGPSQGQPANKVVEEIGRKAEFDEAEEKIQAQAIRLFLCNIT